MTFLDLLFDSRCSVAAKEAHVSNFSGARCTLNTHTVVNVSFLLSAIHCARGKVCTSLLVL